MNGTLYDFKRLAGLRQAQFTQDKFAEQLNINIVTLSRLENGHNASHELILRACQLLDVDSNEIFYSSRNIIVAT